MKDLIINRKSWHYWLASVANVDCKRNLDICSYTRYVIGGILLALLISSFALIIGSGLLLSLYSLVYFYYSIFTGSINWGHISFIELTGLLSSIFIAISFIVQAIKVVFNYFNKNKVKVTTPSFITEAYKSWKNKYCLRVITK